MTEISFMNSQGTKHDWDMEEEKDDEYKWLLVEKALIGLWSR